jgi:putative transposase
MPRHGVVARRPRPTQGPRTPHSLCGAAAVPRQVRPRSPLALSEAEQTLVLQALCSERFCGTAPAAVHATLLDEGRYLGSLRSMYRLLAANASSADRRRLRSHPVYAKPELLATAPHQAWSWDITKPKGSAKWTCFHL